MSSHLPGDDSISAYSVPPSVPVTTLSLGVGAPSSPLSCVKALLSLSPPTKPAMFALALPPRLVFRPTLVLDRATGDGAGEEGGDAVARIRRDATSASIESSGGSMYSESKKESPSSVPDAEDIGVGVDLLELGRSKPSTSCDEVSITSDRRGDVFSHDFPKRPSHSNFSTLTRYLP
jgi:hypothetical protein